MPVSILAFAVGLASVAVGLPSGAGEDSAAVHNQAVIKSYFDDVFLSGDLSLQKWLEDNVADDGVFQFCPLTADNAPSNPYPHCTNAKGKKAYLAYVETDQKEFGNTRISNISYAVSDDGLQVFSRYMVTGTLEGESVPWFDQVMAWRFDADGKIIQTVFWSDTLFWNRLYSQHFLTSASLLTRKMYTTAADSCLLQFVAACAIFLAGAYLGRHYGNRGVASDTDYLQIS